jgi:predicted SAM-dependent methyltransferase
MRDIYPIRGEKRLMLDIGCGESNKEGAIKIDIRKTDLVDIVADARVLPFKEESFDLVYSSHLIEHFRHYEVKNVLKEWIRVLKRGGTVEIRCPWLRVRALLFFLFPTWENVINIYGEQNYKENFHKCGFSFKLLKELLEDCRITKIKWVRTGYKGIPFIPDCLHVRGIKK